MLSARKDILINARRESNQMRHYYMGVEHLFIGLLQIEGGLASSVLEEYGQKPDYVINAIRRKVGKGSRRRLWAGIPSSPRADIVLNIAEEIALEEGRNEIDERDLFTAILEENNNIPTRILKSLSLDTSTLKQAALNYVPDQSRDEYYLRVELGPAFDRGIQVTKEHYAILQRMFHGYMQIRIERALTGYTSALILVVTPIDDDNREDAAVVAKIDYADHILDEAQRYESHVKGALPLITARMEDKPTVPEGFKLGGLKYTLIGNDSLTPQDLRTLAQDSPLETLGSLLQQQLYKHFGKTWWKRQRPFQFQAWKEYDWLLPPVLTLNINRDNQTPPDNRILKAPVSRVKFKEMLKNLDYGDLVAIDNFTVQRVDYERKVIKLAVGFGMEADKRAYKVEARGFDPAQDNIFRGEVIERITGTVWKTRHDLLNEAVRALNPEFDIRAKMIPFTDGRADKLPNPLGLYEDLLDYYVNGSLSKIHGDLHLGNIVVGPNESAWLIDFAHTRDGHTLFDWAALEISLLSTLVMRVAGESWSDAQIVLHHLAELNRKGSVSKGDPSIIAALSSVMAIRKIVRECIFDRDEWSEYYVALALCALRGITWETISVGNRRLLFLVAALSIRELNRKSEQIGVQRKTPSPDATDTIPSVIGVDGMKNKPEATPLEAVSDASSLWQSEDVEVRPSQVSTVYGTTPAMGTQPLHYSESVDTEEIHQDTGVQFSAHYPYEIVPDVWQPMYVYVFRQFAADAVTDNLEKLLNVHWTPLTRLNVAAWQSVFEGEMITATPYLEGFQFNPPSVTIGFFEDWHRLDFKLRTRQATPPSASGFITFTVGGIIVGEIPLNIKPTGTSIKSKIAHETCDLYSAIFASFSDQDTHIREHMESFSMSNGMEYLRAVVANKNSVDSDADTHRLIERAQVFQLFWSPNAAASPAVEKEWRHALNLKRANYFIRPVYWTQPAPPIPPELQHIAFLFEAGFME